MAKKSEALSLAKIVTCVHLEWFQPALQSSSLWSDVIRSMKSLHFKHWLPGFTRPGTKRRPV